MTDMGSDLSAAGHKGLSRRAAVAAAGAAAIATASGAFAQGGEAHGVEQLTSATSDPALHATNTEDGPAVLGTGNLGAGVRGDSTDGAGIRGTSVSAAGVRASSTSGFGVQADSDTGSGIRGRHTSTTASESGIQAVNIGLGMGLWAMSKNGDTIFADNQGTGAGVSAIVRNGTAIIGNNLGTGQGVLGISLDAEGVMAIRATEATGDRSAMAAVNDAAGSAFYARSKNGDTIFADNQGTGAGVSAVSRNGPAVFGNNIGSGQGVNGKSLDAEAVSGYRPPNATGIHPAIAGSNDAAGPGVWGRAANGAAIHAEGMAYVNGDLHVVGAVYMRVGNGTIPPNANVVTVADPLASPTGHVSVTLVGSPRAADAQAKVAVSWVERAAGSFKIHLTDVAVIETPFTYTIVLPQL